MGQQITVKLIKDEVPGKKSRVIEDTTGKWWYIKPETVRNYAPGVTYDVEFDASDFQGKTYYRIKSARATSSSGAAITPIPQTAQQNRPPDTYDNARRLDIFVCGSFNNLLSNPNINPVDMTMMDMIDVLHKFKGAWNGVFGPSPLPRRVEPKKDPISSGPEEDDMDGDSVPF